MTDRSRTDSLPAVLTGRNSVAFKKPLPWLVLALLLERPSYGYELRARGDWRFRVFVTLTTSHIYQALELLEKYELIEYFEHPDQRGEAAARRREARRQYFRVAKKGAQEYKKWVDAPTIGDSEGVEMVVRIFAAAILGPQALREVVDRHEREVQARVRELEEGLAGLKGDGIGALAMRVALEQQLAVVRASIEWAASALRQIEEHGLQRKEQTAPRQGSEGQRP